MAKTVSGKSTSVEHIFGEVEKISPQGEAPTISLRDGTSVRFPLGAWDQCQHVQPGDRVLIDMGDWRTERELAHIYFYRDGYSVTHFDAGYRGMVIIPSQCPPPDERKPS